MGLKRKADSEDEGEEVKAKKVAEDDKADDLVPDTIDFCTFSVMEDAVENDNDSEGEYTYFKGLLYDKLKAYHPMIPEDYYTEDKEIDTARGEAIDCHALQVYLNDQDSDSETGKRWRGLFREVWESLGNNVVSKIALKVTLSHLKPDETAGHDWLKVDLPVYYSWTEDRYMIHTIYLQTIDISLI
mmetsp:Transcript_33835/g.54828  ORF Transcript_33835/g.54828 Transcript_33835/m.54828 type:complete len:186 (+) Transcript_33835:144-701(+)